MATKTVQKKKNKSPKINVKKVLIIAVAVLLLAALGFGIFQTVDYIMVDTPYDLIHLPDYIVVGRYIGVELSKKEIDEELAESIDKLIDNFSKKDDITKGTVEEGMNVTVAITAKLDGEKVNDVSYNAYEISEIGAHQTAKEENQAFFDGLSSWILEKSARFDFEDGADWDNRVESYKYTYPSNYSVTKLQGKEVTHELVITKVTKTDAPEYNDAFFKEKKAEIKQFLGVAIEFKGVEDFEKYMRHQLELNVLWNDIVDRSKAKGYPKKKLQVYMDEYDEYYDSVMEQQGLSRADLLKQLGTDEDGYAEARKKYAQGIVKEEMILYEIIEALNIRVSAKEYKKIATQLAKEGGYGKTVKDFEEAVGDDVAERTVIWEKVKETILKKAIRVD